MRVIGGVSDRALAGPTLIQYRKRGQGSLCEQPPGEREFLFFANA